MAKLFGFKIQKDDEQNKNVVSPVPQSNEDSSDYYVSSGFYGQYVDIDGVFKSEFELIKRYREMALHPEVDSAIEDIINEAIVSDQNDSPVEIDLENLPASKQLKDLIREEFKTVKEILNFDDKCHEILRNWYVDGRIYYHKVIDIKAPEEGIKEVRYIDPLKIKLVRKLKTDNSLRGAINQVNSKNPADIENPEIEEYYQYDPSQTQGKNALGAIGQTPFSTKQRPVKIAPDAISFCHSGLVDRNKQTILSYLHKSIKALNQLRMIEDSLVIYRLSRAPERRIFYIDVGNLPKMKAEQYLKEVMNRYRNKLVYDASTGEIRDDRKHMSMLEDFWLPRREGGRGTEITTLPGGQNLGELSDIEYFQKKLYRSLGVPESRIAGSGDGFNLGRSSEILRDEIKFTKFVGRMRKRFSHLFNDMLKTQLILKNIVTPEDWEVLGDHIQYDFVYDNHFAELKETELLNERLGVVAAVDPYVGKYFSLDYVRRKILKQKDEEVIEIDKQMEKEIKDGKLADPMEVQQLQLGVHPEQMPGGAMNPQDPNMGGAPQEGGAEQAPQMPEGGEI
ncbi:portal vertex protein [Cyanophage S-SSM6a]|uniref:Portal protein n=2 Tax=Viruses TaxID=10239 RepID=E3SL62_9CAUD|nr:portal protein [Synechococcus phage S-SSM7]ADO98210.1 portal vertex protein of head [Synechococcus phage S-SSM7]AGH07457.1 portal vertex protein [Cyanophage S-SSM6a]